MSEREIPGREMASILRKAGHPDQLSLTAPGWSPASVIDVLGRVLSEERKERIEQVVAGRTRSVVTVVEGIVNTGNVSAVMRTAEALGFQDFHVIRGGNPYKHSVRTTQGAQKWLDVHVWEETATCLKHLKSAGYAVVATHLDEHAAPMEEVDFTRPTAVVFGNELAGASRELLELADRTMVIPSSGFVQSFNISVAAAMVLHHAAARRRTELGSSGDLTEAERELLTAEFYVRAVNHARDILAREGPPTVNRADGPPQVNRAGAP